jgi:hypothetical protein
MIRRIEMIDPMLVACPSFAPAWEAFCAEWNQERTDPPLYIALAELARHIVDLQLSGKTDELPAVFKVIERWHCEGEHFVREAATVGLLEDIQNIIFRIELEPAVLERWLLPESRKWWDKLNRFWEGDLRALRED